MNTSQRPLELRFTGVRDGGAAIGLRPPPTEAGAPPGCSMLFPLDAKGVPARRNG